jgi:hypothetical protein
MRLVKKISALAFGVITFFGNTCKGGKVDVKNYGSPLFVGWNSSPIAKKLRLDLSAQLTQNLFVSSRH